MKPVIPASLLLAIWTTLAMCGPVQDAKHTAEIIRGCRLVDKGFAARTELDAMLSGTCIGILGTLSITGNQFQPNARICAPSGFTTQQAIKVFLKFIDDHPERLNEIIEILAIDALRIAWPCRTSN